MQRFIPPALAGLAALAALLAGAPAPASAAGAWPGALALSVDATDLNRRILRVQQVIPLPSPLPATLALRCARFPPGDHGPYGDVSRLAGLVVQAGTRRLAWRRDSADPYTFVVEGLGALPADTRELTLDYQYLAPVPGSTDRATITRALLGIEWDTVLLYPAGPQVASIRVQPRLRLPGGWLPATALRGPGGEPPRAGPEGWLSFGEVSAETLVDSPLFAGPHLKQVTLDPPGSPRPVLLSVFADDDAALAAKPAQWEAHRALVAQADKLFGGERPWRHYDLMLALSDEFGGVGLEHHESSENGLRPDYFKDWDDAIRGRELLGHEYVHAWNGKHRRPASLAAPDYQQATGNQLLWVYEGLTEYWGRVLTTRAGLDTPEQARDRLAYLVADLGARQGRLWRPLQDTVNDPALGPGWSREWDSWQRHSDYYDEASLVWLEADLALRAASGGRRSLDDLARRFFGVAGVRRPDGSPAPLTYTEEDLLGAMEALQPLGWRRFLHERLDDVGRPVPGLAGSGWRLGWADEESSFQAHERGWDGPAGNERPQDLAWSLGLRVLADGTLTEVFWRSPAFDAGLTKGMVLVAVNDLAYKPERAEAAVRANLGGHAPIRLLVKDGEAYRSVAIDWRGGLRYPRLEREPGTPDRLTDILKPR